MKAVHLKRTFLKRSETFIYRQMLHLPPGSSIMLARDLENVEDFPGISVKAFSSEPRCFGKLCSHFAYTYLRTMSGYERDFFQRAVQDAEPDLFHAHYVVDAAYFLGVADRYRIPLIVSCYGYDVSSFPRSYGGYGQCYLQGVLKKANLFLAMSEDMKKDLLAMGVDERRIVLHYPNGCDPTRYDFRERHPERHRKIRLLCVAMFEEKKGIEYLLEALAKALKHTHNLELRLVGDGPLRPRIDAKIKALGIQQNVSQAGFLSHDKVAAEYSAADLFCLPSITSSTGEKEGIPGVLVEAMASGLPVVSTWHAGIPEAVLDGITGYLVRERATDELCERLVHLVDHPELWGELGRAGRKHVEEHFDSKVLAAKLENIYDTVL